MAMRDDQVDRLPKGAVAFTMDFRPTTLLEQSLNDGHDRVNKPVGIPTTVGPETQTTGGARMGDAVVAINIGANGRKK